MSEDLKPLLRSTAGSNCSSISRVSARGRLASEGNTSMKTLDPFAVGGSLAAECDTYIDGGSSDTSEIEYATDESAGGYVHTNTPCSAKKRTISSSSSCDNRSGVSPKKISNALSIAQNDANNLVPSVTTCGTAVTTAQPSTSQFNNGTDVTAGSHDDADNNRSLLVQVTSLSRSWVVRRTYENFRFLDQQLHRCCYDRKFSQLLELPTEDTIHADDKEVRAIFNEAKLAVANHFL